MKRYVGWGLGGSQVQDPLSPWSWECVTLLAWVWSPAWKFSDPNTSGILWRRHRIGMINPSLHFQPFSLLRRMGEGRAETSETNHGLVFPGTSPRVGAIQEPTQKHLSRVKDCRPGSYKVFCSSVSGIRVKDQRQKCSWRSYQLGDTRVSGVLCQELERETDVDFPWSHKFRNMSTPFDKLHVS